MILDWETLTLQEIEGLSLEGWATLAISPVGVYEADAVAAYLPVRASADYLVKTAIERGPQ